MSPEKPRTWPYALIADDVGRFANVRKPCGLLVFTKDEPIAFAKWIRDCLNEAFDLGTASPLHTPEP